MRFVCMDFDDANFERPFFFYERPSLIFYGFPVPRPIFFYPGVFHYFPRFKEIARERSSNGHFKDYQAGLLSWWSTILEVFTKLE